MDFNEKLEKLEKSDVFMNWKNDNPDVFLAHFFINSYSGEAIWEIGFYDSEKNLMTHFEVGEDVSLKSSDSPFVEPESKITPLVINDLKTGFNDALSFANSFVEKERPSFANETRILAILSNSPDGAIWNITFMKSGTEILNVKLSSSDGKVISHNIINFLNKI